MNQARLDQIIEAYLNDSLSNLEWDQLNEELEKSATARESFRESVSIHQGLSDFHSIREPILPLDATFAGRSKGRRSAIPLSLWLAFSVLMVALMPFLWWRSTRTATPLARIVSSNSMAPGPLTRGTLSIDTGFAEVEMQNGARFALDGGTTIRLISGSRIRLIEGSIGAEVPKRARGFTVETSQGNIVDLGTRFGVTVDRETGKTESELFDGEIEIHAAGEVTHFRGQTVIALSDGGKQIDNLGTEVRPQRFPMPELEEIIPVVKGDFEPGENYEISDAKEVRLGAWGGNYARIVEQSQGIVPYRGKGMLKLVSSSPDELASGNGFCDVIQWVDLRSWPLEAGTITARARINRVAGDERTDTQFALMVSAHGQLNEEKLIMWQTVRQADPDPTTWETLEVTAELVPGTRFISLRVGAYENTTNNMTPGEVEFDGHFIDKVELNLSLPARPSVR